MGDSRETLRVSIDYGTVAASMAAWIARNGEQPSSVYQIPIHGTSNGLRNTPQAIAYTDGVLLHGEDLETSLQNGVVLEELTIRRLKLYLYPSYRDSDSGKRIRRQLEEAGKWDYEMIGEHLKSLLSLVRPFFKMFPDGRTATQIDDLEMQLFILIPACWDISGRQTMVAAASTAGIEMCQVVTESRAALCAFDKQAFHGITTPTTVLLADGGGGTLDCMSADIQPIQPGSDGNIVAQTPGIDLVCKCNVRTWLTVFRTLRPSSKSRRIEMVDENLIRYVTSKANRCPEIETLGGLEKFLQTRNTTLPRLRAKLSAAFKPVRETFTPRIHAAQSIILDFPEAPSDSQMIKLILPSELIREFFEPVIQDWIKILRSMVTENTKSIILTGGFSHNRLLQSRLLEEFEDDVEVKLPRDTYEIEKPRLAIAVQEVFKDIVPMPLPPGRTWGLTSDEKLDPKFHEHCYLPNEEYSITGRKLRNQKKKINPARVRNVQEDGKNVMYAPDCIVWLITTVESSDDDVPQSVSTTLEYNVKDDARPYEVPVVSTDQIPVKHKPLWDANGQLPKDVTLVDPLPSFHLPLEELGYISSAGEKGQKWFMDVKMETQIVLSSHEVRVKLKVFPCATRGGVRSNGTRAAGWIREKVIWSEWRSSVVRDNPTQENSTAPANQSGVVPQHQRALDDTTAREEEVGAQREPDSGSEIFVPQERSPAPAPSESPETEPGQDGTVPQEHPATVQDDQVEEPQNTLRRTTRRTGMSKSLHQIQREAEAEATLAKTKGKK